MSVIPFKLRAWLSRPPGGVVLSMQSGSDSGPITSDLYTNNQRPDLQVYLPSNVAEGDPVIFRDGVTVLLSRTITAMEFALKEFYPELTALSEGVHPLSVEVDGALSNTLTVTVDLTAPEATFDATNNVLQDGDFDLTLTADEDDVTWEITGGADEDNYSLAGGVLSLIDTSDVGANVVEVTPTDLAGNVGDPVTVTTNVYAATVTETQNWIDAVEAIGGTVSPEREILVNTWFVQRLGDSSYGQIEFAFLLAEESGSKQSRICLKRLTDRNSSTVGTPTLVADRGLQGSSVSGGGVPSHYAGTGFVPSTDATVMSVTSGFLYAIKYDNNSSFWGFYGAETLHPTVGMSTCMLAYAGGSTDYMRLDSLADETAGSSNGGNFSGRYMARRTGTTRTDHKNGTLVLTDSSATAPPALTNQELLILAMNTRASGVLGAANAELGFVAGGAYLDDTQSAAFDNDSYALLNAINPTAYP